MERRLVQVLVIVCIAVIQVTSKPVFEDVETPEEPEAALLSSAEEACIAELQLDKDSILQSYDGDVLPEDNEGFNAFLGCYWRREKWISKKGRIYYDRVMQMLSEISALEFQNESPEVKMTIKSDYESAVKHCQAMQFKGRTPGETVVKFLNCFVRLINQINE